MDERKKCLVIVDVEDWKILEQISKLLSVPIEDLSSKLFHYGISFYEKYLPILARFDFPSSSDQEVPE